MVAPAIDLDAIGKRLTNVETSLDPGAGRFLVGMRATRDFVGVGATVEARLNRRLSLFADAEAGYLFGPRRAYARAVAGFGVNW